MSDSFAFNKGTNGVQPSPQCTEKFEQLKDLLRAMFQLDRGDLDFGLYRIMNPRAAEIEAHLKRLPEGLTEALTCERAA
ncbi:MAG: hypothetical protein OXG96_11720 [Acidobacteria bacterium]|nr:hypothetical protein [Acidobacteriota bacterium]